MKLLIIEDEKITRISLSDILTREGYEVFAAGDGEEGLEIFRTVQPQIVITDMRLPKLSGMEVLRIVMETAPACKVILITAFATVDTAISSLRLGAYDYITKPFSPEKLLATLRNIRSLYTALNENSELRSRLVMLEDKEIVGNAPAMKSLKDTLRQIAANDSTILIEGESGTGKELIARSLHKMSPRRDGQFVAVSCSNIPESLLESELFGHEKGAFTGAIKKHIGYFERATKGTLLIDDIDDFPPGMQVKLLRVIQERELIPVGASASVPIDVRIICATKVNLKRRVEAREFREDLYYRLNIIPVRVPPLRERKEDIPLLVDFFFRKHRSEDKLMLLTHEIHAALQAHSWPGNVRELENIVERMIALSFSGHIDLSVLDIASRPPDRRGAAEAFEQYGSFEEYIAEKEREMLEWALERCSNSVTDAAKLLKLPRTTLSSKLARVLPHLALK